MKIMWLLGLALLFGVVFERYSFCMNSALTDVYLMRDTRKLKGLLMAVLASAVLFNALIAFGALRAVPWPLLPTAIMAGIVFGIGMNLAGGCVSGSLFKMGQGSGAAILSVLGISLGLGLTGIALSFMPPSGSAAAEARRGATLPGLLGISPLWVAAAAAAAAGMLVLAWRRGEVRAAEARSLGAAGSRALPGAPNFLVGGLLIAGLNTLFFIIGKSPLMMSGLLIYLPSRVAFLISPRWAANNWMFGRFLAQRSYVLMTLIGVCFIAGAFLSAIVSGRFRLRWPVRRQALSSILGGTLMGISIPMMWGCNVTQILGNVPQLGIAGLVSTAGIVIGAWLGARLITRIVARG